MLRLCKKYFVVVFFTMVALAFAVFWAGDGNIYGTDDAFSIHRDESFINSTLYYWEDSRSYGNINTNFPRFLLKTTELILDNNWLTHVLFYTANISLALIFTSLLVQELTNRMRPRTTQKQRAIRELAKIFIPLFYVFAPFNYYYSFSDQTGYQWLVPFIPFFFYCSFKLYNSGNPYLWALVLGAGSLYFGPAMSQVTLLVLFLLSALLLIIFARQIRRQHIYAWLLVGLCWAWIMVPLVFSIGPSLQAANKGGVASNLIDNSSLYNTPVNSLTFSGYSPIRFMAQQPGVMLNREGVYYLTVFFTVFVLLLTCLILLYLGYRGRDRTVRTLGILYAFIFFFVSNISYGLTSKIPVIRNAFRNAFHKWEPYYGLIFAILLVLAVIEMVPLKRRWQTAGLLVIGLCIFAGPFLISSPIYRGGILKSYYVRIPSDYAAYYEKFGKSAEAGQKVLVLPINLYGTTFFTWVSSVEQLLLDQYTNESISSIRYMNQTSMAVSDDFNKAVIAKNSAEFVRYLEKYNISRVVYDGNIDWQYYSRLNAGDPNAVPEASYKVILDLLKERYDAIPLGELNVFNTNIQPRLIMADNTQLAYERISPVEYKISIPNGEAVTKIIFRESYDPNWLLIKAHAEPSGVPAILRGIMLAFTSQKIPAMHTSTDSYNEWMITGKNQEFSGDYVLFYLPQAYFYLGLIITTIGISSTASLCYLNRAKINTRGIQYGK